MNEGGESSGGGVSALRKGSVKSSTEDVEVASAVAKPWDDSLPFRRDEFVRVISTCLQGLGYTNASRALEEESGHKAELDESTPSLLSCVSVGRWEEALSLLSSVQFTSSSLQTRARALLLRQRFLELVEDKRLQEALACLRDELAPLFSREAAVIRGEGGSSGVISADSLGPDQLHALSGLLLAPRPMSLKRLSTSGKIPTSRIGARLDTRIALQALLAEGGRITTSGRLETLVAQALKLQTMNCAYHNTLEQKLELSKDHSCGTRMIPQVTSHVLDEHADEVWCCQFSHGGSMLATSSADAVVILWDLDGGVGGGAGAEQGQGRGPSVHKKIEIRHRAPHFIAWSPDDSSLLTGGASPAVTRWDVATGDELGVYEGEHREAVTGVAWLRDGRGFVSAGLDRKVVIWNLGGTVLSRWSCHSRITGIALLPPPSPPAPPLSLYGESATLSPDTAAAAAAAVAAPNGSDSNVGDGDGFTHPVANQRGDNWSNEHWPPGSTAAGVAAQDFHSASTLRVVSIPLPRSVIAARASTNGLRQSQERQRHQHQQRRQSRTPSSSRGGPGMPRKSNGNSPGEADVDGSDKDNSLRRCRVWVVCRENTMQAIDVEVEDYGEPPPPSPRPPLSWSSAPSSSSPPPPPPPPPLGSLHAARTNGADRRGDRSGSNSPKAGHGSSGSSGSGLGGGTSSSGRSGPIGAVSRVGTGDNEDRRDGDRRRRRNRRGGGGSGGGGGGSGGSGSSASPEAINRRNGGVGSCTIVEGPQESFAGRVISGVSVPGDGTQHLLLHMDMGRILSWNSETKKTLKRYHGHRQARYIVRSTFGGLNDRFIASGSEDSLVHLWHRGHGNLIATLPGHVGTVNAVHWNPARPGMLASVSDDQTVRLWEPSLPPPPLPPSEGENNLDDGADIGGVSGVASGGNVENGSSPISRSAAATSAGRVAGIDVVGFDGINSGNLSPSSPQSGREQGTEGRKDRTEESGRGGGGSGSSVKGKGKAGNSHVEGGPSIRGGRSGYGRLGYERAPAQGWEAWDGADGGGSSAYYEAGFSERIAALRW